MNPIDHLHQSFKTNLRRVFRKALLLDKMSATLAPRNPDLDDMGDPSAHARIPIIFGLWMTILVFGVFGLWSVIARLDSAAIASGRVVVDSNRKTIDHLEGGIVQEILVQDGMIVDKGQPLVRLSAINAKARVQLLADKYNSYLAVEARMLAERENRDVVFPKELTDKQDKPDIAELLANQMKIHQTRMQSINGQIDILKKRIAQSEQEIKGLELQAESMENQDVLLKEEISVVAKLLSTGNAVKPRLLALKRQSAELNGRKGEYLAMKAKAEENINETNLQILNTQSEFQNKVEEELKDAQLQLQDLRERITASSEILDRIVIRSPERGIVNNMKVHTVGGVVKPGEAIMDIIPTADKMIIEAKVSPLDIDVVQPDLKARVRLTAYKSRQVPPVDGKVLQVSAEPFTDERTGASYFTARVEIDAKELDDLKGIRLYPGMPAEVLIITGSRSFFQYMMDPITQSFQHSFKQQ